MSGIGQARRPSVCRVADACYHSEHHCCTDNGLQCIMRSVMHSASNRVHSITSLVPAQLSDCNTIHQHHPSLDGRSLCGLVIWRALLLPGSVTVYPCDSNTDIQIRHGFFAPFFIFFWWCPQSDNIIFGPGASEQQLSSKMRPIVLHSPLSSPPER